MIIGNGNEIIAVDDSEADIFLIETFYKRSKFQNKFSSFLDPIDFINYMKSIDENNFPIPELILLDINMPYLNGFELLKEIKNISKFSNIPILFILSASDLPEDKKKALDFGASGFLEKKNLKQKSFFYDLQKTLENQQKA